MSTEPSATATLLLSCPDQPGIVADVAAFVAGHEGNIIHAEQHTDAAEGVFFQRVEFELRGFDLDREDIASQFAPVVSRYGMDCRIRYSDSAPRAAVLVSKQGHCLHDLLGRWHMGELPGELAVVISNHEDHRDVVERFDVPFLHLPVDNATRATQEQQMAEAIDEAGADLIVMARYMQILTPDFVDGYPSRIINIHHSFLPAFPGGRPYHQAHERGVKIVGVTAHYATAELDQGPIIEQDVVRVSHRDDVAELVRKGRDLEMVVLARAVRAHLEDRILVYGNKTVVFD